MAVGTAHAGTLNELLDARVADGGDDPALIQGDTRITYAEVAARVRRVAAGLARLGIGPGDRVAVWLGNDPAWIELEFALARLGAVAVAINTKYRRHEVEDIVGAYLFLASDAAGHFRGQCLSPNGGDAFL